MSQERLFTFRFHFLEFRNHFLLYALSFVLIFSAWIWYMLFRIWFRRRFSLRLENTKVQAHFISLLAYLYTFGFKIAFENFDVKMKLFVIFAMRGCWKLSTMFQKVQENLGIERCGQKCKQIEFAKSNMAANGHHGSSIKSFHSNTWNQEILTPIVECPHDFIYNLNLMLSGSLEVRGCEIKLIK